MDRRTFIQLTGLAGVTALATQSTALSLIQEATNNKKWATPSPHTQSLINRTLKAIEKHNINDLPIGKAIGRISQFYVGTPYKGGTLEGPGEEVCRVELGGLDCVTFFESMLNFARTGRSGLLTSDDFFQNIIFTRYRGGKVDGYSSRLHYTSDWIVDNVKKGVVKDISKELGGKEHTFNLNFMTSHPEYYPGMKGSEKDKMLMIENRMRSHTFHVIPKEDVRSNMKMMQTGDIVCFTTGVEGLDFGHTGLIYVNDDLERRLLHASSDKEKVLIDIRIDEYIESVEKHKGLVVLRPL